SGSCYVVVLAELRHADAGVELQPVPVDDRRGVGRPVFERPFRTLRLGILLLATAPPLRGLLRPGPPVEIRHRLVLQGRIVGPRGHSQEQDGVDPEARHFFSSRSCLIISLARSPRITTVWPWWRSRSSSLSLTF